QIKRVVFVAGRMVWRRVQSIEAVPLGFDIGSFSERKTHSSKNLNSTLVHLMKRMQKTNVVLRSRKRDVYTREPVGFFFSADFSSALVKRRSNGIPRLIEQFTDDRAFLFTQSFHPLAPFGDAAAFAEIFHTNAFERSLVARSFNLAQRVIAELFERVHGFRESLNRYIVKSGNRISIHESRFTSHAAFLFFFSSAARA